jgi:hypothetical protein
MGVELVWSPQEVEIIDMICRQIDRKVELDAYQDAEDVKAKVKLSAELRLVENSIARMLQQVKIEVPAQSESLRTIKARRAARARWDNSA